MSQTDEPRDDSRETIDLRSPGPGADAAPSTPRPADPAESSADGEAGSSSDAPPSRIGPYTILGLLGQGGMGAVYLANQESPVRRRVALKLLHGGVPSKDILARFDSERQALALMDHSCIARVFDGGTTPGGRPYFVMEHVPGQPITEYCDRNRLSTEDRLHLFLKVCAAVHHAHQKGVIHRDLKPNNILVTPGDGRAEPKVIDFGVAKAIERPLTDLTVDTVLGQLMGTPAYMSPEQAAGDTTGIDTRTDIYSLGVVLYEILVGALPIHPPETSASNLQEVLRQIREEEPAKPSTRLGQTGEADAGRLAEQRRTDVRGLVRRLRGDLDWILLKALEKDPARRYASASELAADIERHLADEPVLAGPPSATYRLGKFFRKHRTAVSVAVVFGAGLWITLVAITWLLLVVSDERDAAETARGQAVAQQGIAESQRRLASSRELSAAAKAQNQIDPDLSLLLALEAYEIAPTSRAEDAIREALLESHVRVVLRGHEAMIDLARFGPDGRRVLTAARDGTVRIWDAETGEQELVLGGHESLVRRAAFSPDGMLVATNDTHGSSRLWDATTGQVLLELTDETEGSRGLAFHPEGHLVASAAAEGPVRVWNVKSREPVVDLEYPGAQPGDLRWSPDGRFLAVGGKYDPWYNEGIPIVQVWDTETWAPLASLATDLVWVMDLQFAPDGRTLAIGGAKRSRKSDVYIRPDQGVLRIHDPVTGELRGDFAGHASFVQNLDFNSDGSRLVSASSDSTVRVWDVASGKADLVIEGHTAPVITATFTPDDERVVSAGHDGVARVWDARTGAQLSVLRGHAPGIVKAGPDLEGRRILTAGQDGTARLWDLGSASAWRSIPRASFMEGLRYDPGGDRIATSQDHLRTWDARTGRLDRESILWTWERATVVHPFSDRRRVAVGDFAGRVRLWDLERDVPLWETEGSDFDITGLRVDRDEQRLLWAATDGKARLGSVATGEERLVLEGHESGPVWDVAFLEDGPWDGSAVSAGEDGTIRIWSLDDAREISTLRGHDGPVRCLDVSPDGQTLASGGRDGTVRLWSFADGSERATLRAHVGAVTAVDFSPGGSELLTAGRDARGRLWDVTSAGPISVITGHQAAIAEATFSPDGRWILMGDVSGIVRRVPVEVYGPIESVRAMARRRVTRALTPAERQRYLHEEPSAPTSSPGGD